MDLTGCSLGKTIAPQRKDTRTSDQSKVYKLDVAALNVSDQPTNHIERAIANPIKLIAKIPSMLAGTHNAAARIAVLSVIKLSHTPRCKNKVHICQH